MSLNTDHVSIQQSRYTNTCCQMISLIFKPMRLTCAADWCEGVTDQAVNPITFGRPLLAAAGSVARWINFKKQLSRATPSGLPILSCWVKLILTLRPELNTRHQPTS